MVPSAAHAVPPCKLKANMCAQKTPGIKVDHMLHAGEVSDTQLAMADER